MSPIRLTHIRHGFTTNSSSTHSILEVEHGQRLPEPRNTEWGANHAEDDFVASDRPSRINYLHAMAADAARDAGHGFDESEIHRLYLQLAAVIPGTPLGNDEMRDLNLDSLCGYAIPRKIHSRDMDVDFFKYVVRLLLSENIVIFGGPWGDEQPWEKQLEGNYISLLSSMHTVSRRISENEWTLLNLHDGTKYGILFSDEGRQIATPITTRALEMVDVSISNACSRQCPFCYRASTPDGLSADMDDLTALVAGLKGMDAMEMVIGGGEPTEHPDFYRFLKNTAFGDLCVSFTTRDLNFIRSLAKLNGVEESEVIDVIRNKIKAVGLSVRTAEEVEEAECNLAALLQFETNYSATNPQIVFHVIPGSGYQKVLDAIVERKHSLLLLGMKFTGRNLGADQQAYADALKSILKDERLENSIGYSFHRGRARLGVDTKFIADAQSIDPDWLSRFMRKSWSDKEGERSAFIDLVEGTMVPCSFGGEPVQLNGYDAASLNLAFGQIRIYKPLGLEPP